MKLIGYRFKSHEEECWSYTYDLKGVRSGKGVKEYGYVEPVYVDDERNYVQVEIPKVPRWLSDILSECQTNDYKKFRTSFYNYTLMKLALSDNDEKEKLNYISENQRNIDLAISLGVWEIDNKQEF